MKTENAHFKSLEYWLSNTCKTLDDVLDLARCIENLAFPVIHKWYGIDGSENSPLPSVKEMLKQERFDVTTSNSTNPKTGWLMAEIPIPHIAKYFTEKQYGNFSFTYYTGLDLDIYCDERLIEKYSYMGGHFPLNVSVDTPHYIFLRIDTPNANPISDLVCRCYLSGLKETNDIIRDFTHSIRAGCHLLSKSNTRQNLYLKGEVDINNSKLTAQEYSELYDCILKTANFAINALKRDNLLSSLNDALNMLKPLADYAHRFTIYLIGHSHIDLAWKWRYPESIECMKGTFETQLELMEREPEYVYVETSAVLWRDMKKLYPDFWKKIRAAAERGQFEPQGGMWCETDGQCVGEESWFRQIEFGQKAAFETCGKTSTCAMNIDAFGFNRGLPKILKKAGLPYFVTQKLRYNEMNIFPYIHFWWEGDDGSKILVLHEYPSHANHIEPDELAKTVCIHHLTDGFYHIPLLWGYGNHGGGPLPVMMDRIDELKSQTVFPNIKYSGFTEFYNILCENEDINSLPIVRDELFLETHHKTYTVQAKTKYLNRECERRLLNAESLQAVVRQYNNIDFAWEKHLFNQFHDVLAGTSLPQVYEDLYENYTQAFDCIENSNKLCAKKALNDGAETYIFNPLSHSVSSPVLLNNTLKKTIGYLSDSLGQKIPYQKTHDDKIVFVTNNLPAYSFEKYSYTDGAPNTQFNITDTSVDNGTIKVSFNKNRGVINSIIFDNKEFCNGAIGDFKVLEDTKSRDYDTWNFGFTGTEWNVNCNSFELIEQGPVRVVFRAKYSFGVWTDKKPYYGTYLWHTPGVEYPTSFLTQDFIIYHNEPMIRCLLKADWWEDWKVLKVSAETNIDNPHAIYKIPFGTIERPTKRETSYEKARYEVPSHTYGDIRNDKYGFALLNRSKHGYDVLNNRIRLTLLTSPYNEDKAKVPDSTADRGKHTIEYAFMPHNSNSDINEIANIYERDIMVLSGSDAPNIPLHVSLLNCDTTESRITSIRILPNGNIEYKGVDKSNRITVKTFVSK